MPPALHFPCGFFRRRGKSGINEKTAVRFCELLSPVPCKSHDAKMRLPPENTGNHDSFLAGFVKRFHKKGLGVYPAGGRREQGACWPLGSVPKGQILYCHFIHRYTPFLRVEPFRSQAATTSREEQGGRRRIVKEEIQPKGLYLLLFTSLSRHIYSFFFLISLIIQQAQITITAQSSNPVKPMALIAKSSPKNGKKLNIAPPYHRIINPTTMKIAFLMLSFFITYTLPNSHPLSNRLDYTTRPAEYQR